MSPSRRLLMLAALASLTACGTPTDTPSPSAPGTLASADNALRDVAARAAVLHWNEVATAMVSRVDIPAPLPPAPEALFYAMTSGAVHDVLNAIDRRYEPYAYAGRASGSVDVAAAVAAAAHGVLAAVATGIKNDPVFPNSKPLDYVDAAYASYLATLADGAGKTAGIALGQAVAGAMLAERAGDGSAGLGLAPYPTPGTPGAYRPTPPFVAPDGITGVADAPGWGAVRPFVLSAPDAFRAPAPYGTTDRAAAVRTARYTADFDEVKALGGAVSSRSADETAIAFFWLENSPLGWNRVARALGDTPRFDAWRLARLLALVQLAEADSYIASFDSKYAHAFWRPITAIRLAADDGNDATAADPSWDVASSLFGVPTPPVPDYPSAHSSAGGAAEAVLQDVVRGRTAFTMESSSLPGQARSFGSVTEAARENAVSRVYVGYHFRLATEAGLEQGRQVGRYVVAHALLPVHGRPEQGAD
ncbi:MAG TPA: vanadium-dependent haloperoxidase [Gemmatimonadales bacterium]|nr:vanadium-dependent haloperoxidase [Gemmatimonadales bacterium]